MTKTCTLAALPLILSLTMIATVRAQPAHAWRDAYGSVVVIPHRNVYEYSHVRGEERWFAPPREAQSQEHAKDPFADLHFE